ncbi:MAG TPA: endolytic transglycosylase MltG [Candidatus Magasanikbacteria bacterium]|nr:endolytic transglycosylase MltG [Candidatus Magasanikbacteria bacterium]
MRRLGILIAVILLGVIFCGVAYIKFQLSPTSFASESFRFVVREGESVGEIARELGEKGVVRNAWYFQKYLSFHKLDKKIGAGEFVMNAPYTVAHIAEVLTRPGVSEETITILPGWDLDEMADALAIKLPYFKKSDFTKLAGESAHDYRRERVVLSREWGDLKILADRPEWATLEGYLPPDTFRVYKNSTAEEVLRRLLSEREKQIDDELWTKIQASGRSFYDILTMASVLEKEVRTEVDRRIVADIFWRRFDMNWALQSDATVHYAVRKEGSMFTTATDRETDSPWNTYRYPGLPLGPICMPSVMAIRAASDPEKNDYWYFLTTKDGEVRYAKDLDGHNRNKINAY